MAHCSLQQCRWGIPECLSSHFWATLPVSRSSYQMDGIIPQEYRVQMAFAGTHETHSDCTKTFLQTAALCKWNSYCSLVAEGSFDSLLCQGCKAALLLPSNVMVTKMRLLLQPSALEPQPSCLVHPEHICTQSWDFGDAPGASPAMLGYSLLEGTGRTCFNVLGTNLQGDTAAECCLYSFLYSVWVGSTWILTPGFFAATNLPLEHCQALGKRLFVWMGSIPATTVPLCWLCCDDRPKQVNSSCFPLSLFIQILTVLLRNKTGEIVVKSTHARNKRCRRMISNQKCKGLCVVWRRRWRYAGIQSVKIQFPWQIWLNCTSLCYGRWILQKISTMSVGIMDCFKTMVFFGNTSLTILFSL